MKRRITAFLAAAVLFCCCAASVCAGDVLPDSVYFQSCAILDYEGQAAILYDDYSGVMREAFRSMKAGENVAPGARLEDLDALMALDGDDTKYIFDLYENGVSLSVAAPGEQAESAVFYTVDRQAYDGLIEKLREKKSAGREYRSLKPIWLHTIRKSSVQSLRVVPSDGSPAGTYLPGDDRFILGYNDLQNLTVASTGTRVGPATLLPDAAKIEMSFVTGVRYTIQINDRAAVIASSDMDYALRYDLSGPSEFNYFNNLYKYKIAPNTGKPVVYLYPEEPTDVAVKVDYKGTLYTTYPAYQDGWFVTAYPDGRIINKSDGTEYYYLFWDGFTDFRWDFNEGFVVPGDEAEAFLREKLSYMGLTPREYNDFIVFWLPELHRNPYNLVMFATDQYEELAGMEITPVPDSILRVHMVFKRIGEPVEIREQTLKPFTRKGFTVVEWGGSRA